MSVKWLDNGKASLIGLEHVHLCWGVVVQPRPQRQQTISLYGDHPAPVLLQMLSSFI